MIQSNAPPEGMKEAASVSIDICLVQEDNKMVKSSDNTILYMAMLSKDNISLSPFSSFSFFLSSFFSFFRFFW